MAIKPAASPEYVTIFVKSFRYWRTGKIVRAKGRAIPLRIRIKPKR